MPTRRQFLTRAAQGFGALALVSARAAALKPSVAYTFNTIRSDIALPQYLSASLKVFFDGGPTLIETPFAKTTLKVPRTEYSGSLPHGTQLKLAFSFKSDAPRLRPPDFKSEPTLAYGPPQKVSVRHPDTGDELFRYQIIATRTQIAVPTRLQLPDIDILLQILPA